MKAEVSWLEGRTFEGTSGSGFSVMMTGSSEGEDAKGASPMEHLLLGLGGCATYDVIHILERGRQHVTNCAVAIKAERATEDPKVFTRIHLHFTVSGDELNPAKVGRAVELSAEKYCSASAMLGKTADITHDYTITEHAD